MKRNFANLGATKPNSIYKYRQHKTEFEYKCYNTNMIIAIDTGGTKTLVVSFDNNGEVIGRQKFPTPRNQGEYIKQAVMAVRQLSDGQSIEAIGLAVPGVVRDQKAVICKNLGWKDYDILKAMQEHLPDVPMWLENDANLGCLGVARLISPAPQRCLYITVSTGIGGGFVVDNTISTDVSENEVSDMIFEYDGKLIRWGGLANGRAIMDKYGIYATQLTNPDDTREISRRISRGLLVLLPILRPDLVAFGGGIGAHYELFAPDVEREIAILPEQYLCPIITSPHPQEIVAYGCYFYAKSHLSD